MWANTHPSLVSVMDMQLMGAQSSVLSHSLWLRNRCMTQAEQLKACLGAYTSCSSETLNYMLFFSLSLNEQFCWAGCHSNLRFGWHASVWGLGQDFLRPTVINRKWGVGRFHFLSFFCYEAQIRGLYSRFLGKSHVPSEDAIGMTVAVSPCSTFWRIRSVLNPYFTM